MTKCLSCGHERHDLELNCPKCGSFYSSIVHDFLDDEQRAPANNLLVKIKNHLDKPKHRWFAISTVIFLVIAVLFL